MSIKWSEKSQQDIAAFLRLWFRRTKSKKYRAKISALNELYEMKRFEDIEKKIPSVKKDIERYAHAFYTIAREINIAKDKLSVLIHIVDKLDLNETMIESSFEDYKAKLIELNVWINKILYNSSSGSTLDNYEIGEVKKIILKLKELNRRNLELIKGIFQLEKHEDITEEWLTNFLNNLSKPDTVEKLYLFTTTSNDNTVGLMMYLAELYSHAKRHEHNLRNLISSTKDLWRSIHNEQLRVTKLEQILDNIESHKPNLEQDIDWLKNNNKYIRKLRHNTISEIHIVEENICKVKAMFEVNSKSTPLGEYMRSISTVLKNTLNLLVKQNIALKAFNINIVQLERELAKV